MSEDYRFLNPYNFVRCLSPVEREEESPQAKLLGRCTPPPHDRYIGLTGKIDCILEAKTPIFVSDSEFVGEKCSDHKSYRFFKLRDENGQEKKAIPATSLRGMLRNVFEAATNSCFGVFEGGLLGKREDPSKYEGELYAGLIERVPAKEGTQGQVKKMKAYKVPHKKFAGYKNNVNKNGKKVFVKLAGNKVEDIKEEPTDKYQEGFMKTSGPGPKKNEYVFMESGSPEEFILPFKVYQDYIIANRNNRIPHTRELKIGDTIWFRVREKEVKELGFAKTYRKPFKKSIDELLPKPSMPCSDYDNLCPACRLFGWVNPRETIEAEELHTDRAYAGRVRISPALMDKDVGLIGEIALEILSTPKPTTTYFYLLDQQGKPKFKIEYSTYGAQIRGRKFYRHQAKPNKREYGRDKRDLLNRTLIGVPEPGAEFKFTVDFENLAPVELGALLWSLEMEEKMHHKLGLGKPLGLGSVQIKIQNLKILDYKTRYSSFESFDWKDEKKMKKQWIEGFKTTMSERYGKAFDKLRNIEDLKAILSPADLPIHYPRSSKDKDTEGRNYEWFQNNEKYAKEPLELAPEDTKGFPIKFERRR